MGPLRCTPWRDRSPLRVDWREAGGLRVLLRPRELRLRAPSRGARIIVHVTSRPPARRDCQRTRAADWDSFMTCYAQGDHSAVKVLFDAFPAAAAGA
jgi:hypothetical protein